MLGVVTRLAGGGSVDGVASGSVDGTGSAAMYDSPSGVAISSSGTVYVVDRYNNRIRMISPAGTHYEHSEIQTTMVMSSVCYCSFVSGVVTTFVGGGDAEGVNSGAADGVGVSALFSEPLGIGMNSSGSIIVSDSGNNLIRMISPTGLKYELY